MTNVRPPAHLAPATRKWFASVVAQFQLEDHHVRLLILAAEAWDRVQEARAAIAQHGMVFQDRFGAPRLRPEVAVERDSRIAFVRILRELGLDAVEPDGPRPPPLRGQRGG